MAATWTDPGGVKRDGSELVDQRTGRLAVSLIRYPARESFNREYYEVELYDAAADKTHAYRVPSEAEGRRLLAKAKLD